MREQDDAGSGLEDDASPARDHEFDATRKRARESGTDRRYPRKRALKACHVCRARKTKCDNVQPTCGFCASIGVRCSFDDTEKDHSSFDAASLEILRQLGQIATSQEDLLQIVRSFSTVQTPHVASDVASFTSGHVHQAIFDQSQGAGGLEWSTNPTLYSPTSHRLDEQQDHNAAPLSSDTYTNQRQPDSASTTPAASGCAPAVRWFGLLANDAPSEILQDAELQFAFDGTSLEVSAISDEDNITPLQMATRIVDKQRTPRDNLSDRSKPLLDNGPPTQQTEEALWQASEGISLLPSEQMFFENFLRRICPWVRIFRLVVCSGRLS
ncbi:uncharacterized protein A1O9_07699 [Exophiala aquamarina CBS 119918]|uniref:Zn(2)-C6 fungal-type domain-containing protein n=1 Tax=Exophiala aquamarina CBS 119918 TaxID=1182545 RepID=A0A072PA19_9EURO|nr:uncharacterized protein A1O9_07699 [Exophiala aquamarina CBS 119918]KEF56118.1 hypothetical protein A1O9_07699 [Exophiala aquamarina CBS 119918]